MEFGKIKELIKLVDSSSLAVFELQSGNDHIKMDKYLVRGIADNNMVDTAITPVTVKEKVENYVEEELKTTEKETIIEDKNLSVITSPMVGTFYSSASPESTAFVQVGDTIAKGKIICMIEAMNIMNEIESKYNGAIVDCLAKDGDMVEYGQLLFKVKEE